MRAFPPSCVRLAFLVLAAAVTAAATSAFAEDGRLALVTERAVVFKDGTCLIVKKATGTSDAAGEVFTEEVPDAAVLGTFWAVPSPGRLLSMVAGMHDATETTTESVPCTQYLEILRANEGRKATVELDDGKSVAGTIRRVLARTEPGAPEVAADGGVRYVYALGSSRTTTVLQGALFVLAADEGDIVLPVARVRRLVVAGATLEIERKTTEKRTTRRLTFRFEGGAAARELRVMYFRPGVRWIPTYRIELPRAPASAGRARIRLQAELLNEAEDLLDVPIDVVVGVPNFRFRDVVSPFVLERDLRDALRQAAPQLMGQQTMASNFSNGGGPWTGAVSGAAGGGPVSIPADIVTERSEDLFSYTLPRITLRRGQRAAVPVFEADVAYRDVYTWDVVVRRADSETAPGGAGVSPLTLSNQRVWHQIELTNGSGVPWTTGAALVEDGRRPIAQELMTYVPAGAVVRMPLTVAVDVRAEFSEQETARKLGALRWQDRSYARIDKRVRAAVTSRLAAPADLEVRLRLGGRAEDASDGGRVELAPFRSDDWENYTGNPAVNNHSSVTWTLRLEPGASAEREAAVHYFVRD